MIDSASAKGRRAKRKGQSDDDAADENRDGQRQRRPDAARQHVEDGLVVLDRVAEVAPREVGEEADKLTVPREDERAVEAVLAVERGNRLVRGEPPTTLNSANVRRRTPTVVGIISRTRRRAYLSIRSRS